MNKFLKYTDAPNAISDEGIVGSKPVERPSASTLKDTQLSGFVWRYVSSESSTSGGSVVQVKPDERDFNTVISRISNLSRDEDEIQPTDYALTTALTLVYEANQILGRVFARASVAVDEDGSIFIYWRKPERNIELKVPARKQGRHHIYHREGTSYAFERNVTASTLAKWLKWYMDV